MLLSIERLFRGIRRRLRTLYYSRVLKSMGKGCSICGGVLIFGPEEISLGDRVVLNENVTLQSCDGASISLGSRVVLSFGAMILTGGINLHNISDQRGHVSAPVIVEDYAWICAGAIILPGVTVGKGAVVAAGSIVTHDVPPGMVVAGVPAREVQQLSAVKNNPVRLTTQSSERRTTNAH